MDGWSGMDEWLDGWTDGLTDGWDGWINEWMRGWMKGLSRILDGLMDGWSKIRLRHLLQMDGGWVDRRSGTMNKLLKNKAR